MKRIILFCTILLVMMPVCAQKQNEMNTLVAYFSATGTTKHVAEQLAKQLGADLFEIAPEVPYTAADLDWQDKQSRSTLEMQDKQSRPAIATKVADMSKYDRVLIGFPIWWYTCPTIINTFMDSYDFSGKTIVPFATSGGSTPRQATRDLQKSYPKYNFREGVLLNRSSDIAPFIESLKK